MMAKAGHSNVYGYQFDWDEGGKVLWMDFSKMLGAAHGLEIPFVFNRFKILGDADKVLFKKKTLASRETLSREMGSFWAEFARTGVPSTNNSAAWPVYGATSEVIHFDSERDKGIHVRQGGESMDAIVTDLKKDDRVEWMPEYRDRLLAGTDC